jgi:quinol monooxygenase YgiN
MDKSPNVVVMLRATCLAGREKEFKDWLEGIAGWSRLEEGCLEYRFQQDPAVTTEFIVLQKWSTKAFYDRHQTDDRVIYFYQVLPKFVKFARLLITSRDGPEAG